MTGIVCFEPLRLAAASQLRQAGIQLAGLQNLASIRNTLRNLLDLCDHQVWLAGMADQPGSIKALAGFQVINPAARRAVLHLYLADACLDADILKAILAKAFNELAIYRLELAVPAETAAWRPVLLAEGLMEEGRLRNCILNESTKRHQDVLLYSMLRPEYRAMGTAFIPFRLGVFAVTGSDTALSETCFIRFGDRFGSVYQQECAEQLGLLDQQGRLATRQQLDERLAGSGWLVRADAPAAVLEAASQVTGYFSGRLTSFDLPLDLHQGSEFQRKVWLAMSDIPYGSTWTYEELAFRLNPEDWPSARRMARAVGSACGANPLPLILPCHRVIGKDGRLVGFSGGLDIKEFLLDHEIMGIND